MSKPLDASHATALDLNDHAMALCSLVQFFIGNLHRLEYMAYPPEASMVEGADLVHVSHSNSPTQDWFDKTVVVVLYCLYISEHVSSGKSLSSFSEPCLYVFL